VWRGLTLLVVLGAGCSRPKPPTLTPLSARITSIGPAGIGVEVEVAVENPNAVDLAVRSVTAHVILDAKIDMGQMTIPQAVTLPAQQSKNLEFPLSVGWNDLPTVLLLATSNRTIPYEVTGTVSLGGDRLNLDLPFRLPGSITHEQLVQATASSLPSLPFP
jgi:LEA14-like dessication related protein